VVLELLYGGSTVLRPVSRGIEEEGRRWRLTGGLRKTELGAAERRNRGESRQCSVARLHQCRGSGRWFSEEGSDGGGGIVLLLLLLLLCFSPFFASSGGGGKGKGSPRALGFWRLRRGAL